ncbi:hypothetical protein WJX81_006336 [Elliptochloris bilobata]|uniref:Nucleolar protein 6 n=1 Tax=Elliptochloris bilobata TaxID=381761 RepID=A0AAW1RFV8_9CHLO
MELQARELLAEVRVEYVREDALDALLELLRTVLARLPECTLEPNAADGFEAALGVPQKPLRFRPPARIEVVGSYALRAVARPRLAVDVAVEAPAACFDEKDQLNNRYFARRWRWLAALAAGLRRKAAFRTQRWEFLDGDIRRPVLVITPRAKKGVARSEFELRLLPCVAPGTFPAVRLAPDRNNLRTAVAETAAGAAPELLPTPHYNAAILRDMLLPVQHGVLARAAMQLPAFCDAALLLKVWVRAQGLEGEPDGVNGALLSLLTAHLAASGALVPGMSALQAARGVLAALAAPETFARGVFMTRCAECGLPPPPSRSAFRRAYEVAFVDASGWLNLAAHVSCSALAQARAAAARSVALLDRPLQALEVFRAVFLARLPRAAAYDAWWHVRVPEGVALPLGGDLPAWRVAEAHVEALATRALGSRVTAVRAFRRRLPTCADPAMAAPHPFDPSAHTILLAAQMDAAAALRAVDMGPAAEDPAAADFRAFWGDRAELRRFQDGAIAEAVVWEAGPASRHLIVDELLACALGRHLLCATVTGTAGLLDGVLAQQGASADQLASARRGAEAASAKLTRQLRGLSGVALRVLAVAPAAAALRHTAAFPPLPHPLAGGAGDDVSGVPRCLEPLELLVQLEGSGKWPDDAAAFAKARAALGCQLAEALAGSYGLRAVASEACVDVFADGFVFRLYLHSERDAALAARQKLAPVEPSGRVAGAVGLEPSVLAFPGYAQLQQRAQHHGFAAALAGNAPAFPGAAQLARRWVAAHMLSSQVAGEAVELLAAAAFTPEAGLPQPATRLAGFLRFLRILSGHPWRKRPLVVDPLGALGTQARRKIDAAHNAACTTGTGPAMALCMPLDPSGGAWTLPRPSLPVVLRLAALARRSLGALQEHVEGAALQDDAAAAAAAFAPALVDFDALLQLRREALPRAQSVLRAVPAAVAERRGAASMATELLVGADPVTALVAALEARFGAVATLCADACGGALLGVKWRPQARVPHPFDVWGFVP